MKIKHLGLQPYETTWQMMKDFTDSRDESTEDELWIVEHQPVFTLGQAGKEEHILNPGDIPIIKSDRGGQVTYHGPGQLVLYTLIDLRREKIGVRDLVCKLEKVVIALLAEYDITAVGRRDAPGVYVDGKKICSIGLRVRKGRSFHGLALNVDMDLEPFTRINPCGYKGLEMTQCRELGAEDSLNDLAEKLCLKLTNTL